MQYLNKFYKLQRTKVSNALERAIRKTEIDRMDSQKARKKVLFYRKNGLALTQEADGVKRSILLNWQKKI
ncbi:MAG: hypothetical protein LBB44_01410 [Endomicrobium sp.]|jgi:hypothetical protein|nr:hypothetical protein [Endomicrobium sp.]